MQSDSVHFKNRRNCRIMSTESTKVFTWRAPLLASKTILLLIWAKLVGSCRNCVKPNYIQFKLMIFFNSHGTAVKQNLDFFLLKNGRVELFVNKLFIWTAFRLPDWCLRDIQRWSALIQNTFRSVPALFNTWKSLNSAENECFQR